MALIKLHFLQEALQVPLSTVGQGLTYPTPYRPWSLSSLLLWCCGLRYRLWAHHPRAISQQQQQGPRSQPKEALSLAPNTRGPGQYIPTLLQAPHLVIGQVQVIEVGQMLKCLLREPFKGQASVRALDEGDATGEHASTEPH